MMTAYRLPLNAITVGVTRVGSTGLPAVTGLLWSGLPRLAG